MRGSTKVLGGIFGVDWGDTVQYIDERSWVELRGREKKKKSAGREKWGEGGLCGRGRTRGEGRPATLPKETGEDRLSSEEIQGFCWLGGQEDRLRLTSSRCGVLRMLCQRRKESHNEVDGVTRWFVFSIGGTRKQQFQYNQYIYLH